MGLTPTKIPCHPVVSMYRIGKSVFKYFFICYNNVWNFLSARRIDRDDERNCVTERCVWKRCEAKTAHTTHDHRITQTQNMH